MLYTIINIIVGIIFFVALGYIMFRIFCLVQGDEKVIFFAKKRTPFVLDTDPDLATITLVTEIPFRNIGKQNGTIMDCFPRVLLPQEQCDSVEVQAWLTDTAEPRHDGYWKAVIIEPGQRGSVTLYVTLRSRTGDIRSDAKDFPNVNIDIVYQMVGRSDWHIAKKRITLTKEEVQRALLG